MRTSTALLIAGAAAITAAPALAATPVRASAALPAGDALGDATAVRAPTQVQQESDLIGFPVALFIGLFTTIVVVAVIVSGGNGRSPG